MAYIALYRKYRPQTFEEIVGQEHITKILKNQIISGKIAHAYILAEQEVQEKQVLLRYLQGQ